MCSCGFTCQSCVSSVRRGSNPEPVEEEILFDEEKVARMANRVTAYGEIPVGASYWKINNDGSELGLTFVVDSGVGYSTKSNISKGLSKAAHGADNFVSKLSSMGFSTFMPDNEDIVVVRKRNVGFRATRWFRVESGVDGERIMRDMGVYSRD